VNDQLSLTDPRFTDPDAAAEYLEGVRWANGVVCPHCGESEREPYRLKSKATKRRLWKCRACRKQFTVMVGTIFESSHIPLNKWLAAFYLLCSSKKGMSAHQLHRMLGITYKSAWFMVHRIRHAMTQFGAIEPMGGTVEVDETYIGGYQRGTGRKGRGMPHKTPVVTLVERGGQARSFRTANVGVAELEGAIHRNVDPSARIVTDGWTGYQHVGRSYHHEVINHSIGQYVRGDVHTNTVESYFAILKRGINGVYHHVSEAQLHRYLAEFDFRYSNRTISDGQRTAIALAGAEGKRLKYRMPQFRYFEY
jgi:transposase-like protein